MEGDSSDEEYCNTLIRRYFDLALRFQEAKICFFASLVRQKLPFKAAIIQFNDI